METVAGKQILYGCKVVPYRAIGRMDTEMKDAPTAVAAEAYLASPCEKISSEGRKPAGSLTSVASGLKAPSPSDLPVREAFVMGQKVNDLAWMEIKAALDQHCYEVHVSPLAAKTQDITKRGASQFVRWLTDDYQPGVTLLGKGK